MTLADFLDEVAERRKTLVVYAGDEAPDVGSHFETRNVTVERDTLAHGDEDGFVVVREDDEFVGAFGLRKLATLLDPPLFRPWERDDFAEPWGPLYEILSDALFANFDRRPMVAATREIENRAWRIGDGALRVGFQSAGAYAAQTAVYRRMGAESDLTINAYVADDGDVPSLGVVEVFRAPGTEVEDYWFAVYDAAGDPLNACALVAEERSPGSYFGFWTYDPDRVDALSTYLTETYE